MYKTASRKYRYLFKRDNNDNNQEYHKSSDTVYYYLLAKCDLMRNIYS